MAANTEIAGSRPTPRSKKMLFKIKNRRGGLIYEKETTSLAACVEVAVDSGASLSWADLSGPIYPGPMVFIQSAHHREVLWPGKKEQMSTL